MIATIIRLFRLTAFFCAILLGPLSPAVAQENFTIPQFRFESFELPNEEFGNHVQAIAQDSSGFIWFGSQNGLHKWDGYQFKTYVHNALDASTISSSYVECIYVAKDGTLWLGTWGGGLNHFDPESETFTRFLHNEKDRNTIADNYISEVVQDSSGYIWVATQEGLDRINPTDQSIRHFNTISTDPSSLSFDLVRCLYIDSKGILWVGTGWPWEGQTRGGLNRYHPDTESFTRYQHQKNQKNSLTSNAITDIYEDSRGNFWVGTGGDGLHLMDREKGTFLRMDEQSRKTGGISIPKVEDPDLHMRFIYEDQDHKLWLGAWGSGMKYYDPQTQYQIHYYPESHTSSVPELHVWQIFQSRDGTLWGSTVGSKAQVFKIVKEEVLFNRISLHNNSQTNGLYLQEDSILWIGTDNNGLHKINFKEGKRWIYLNDLSRPLSFQPSSLQPNPVNSISEDTPLNNISVIEGDKNGNIWLAFQQSAETSGLIRFNPEEGVSKYYTYQANNPGSLPSDWISDLFIDETGDLWLLCENGVLARYNQEKDSFHTYKLPIPIPTDQNLKVFGMLAQSETGKIWLSGRAANGSTIVPFLMQFESENGLFRSIEQDVNFSDPGNLVVGLQEDSIGNIWVCSRFELRRENLNTGMSEIFYPYQFGLTFFQGMVIDKDGQIWLPGDGLCVFDLRRGTSYIYSSPNRTQVLPFSIHAATQSTEGKIFIGGNGGILFFNPEEFQRPDAHLPPEVIITEFKLLDYGRHSERKPLYTSALKEKRTIRLQHDENVFSFRFAALDFFQPDNNLHEFQLVGYDAQWRKAGTEPVATYVKVPPGRYTFQVRAANRNGIWGATKSVDLIITPPWWATWGAYLIYGLVALGMFYAIYRFQLNRKLAQAEASRLREMDTVKTQLYTNITHEFRTPLTVILGMARQALDNPKEHFRDGLEMIIRNGENLLSLVNQMLDLSKLEGGKLSLHLVQGDIISYLKYLLESFQSFAEAKGIQLHFLSDLEALLMDYDPEKVQQIISNIVSNSVKFTPAGGHVYFSIDAPPPTEASKENYLLVKVRDTGQGIPEADLPHIFDRFYQVDGSDTKEREGSGIGLALSKDLVTLMDGEIIAKSKEGKGTEIIIKLPIRKRAPLQKRTAAQAKTTIATPVKKESKKPKPKVISHGSKTHPSVLIVEDNPDVVQYLSSCLADQYQIHIANDGQEGIDIALDLIPDLIISDIMMPHKDGFEVCRTLKKDERTSHIPIIMLTAKADIESKLTGLQRGAEAYLAKPFHKEELLIRVKNLLELRTKLQQYYLQSAGLTEGATIVRDISKVEEVEDQFVKKVRQIVLDNLDNFEFTVEQLCKDVRMSNSQLHRKLSALTGLSATKFIRYVRLNKAKELLSDPELKITAVAFDTGFNDPSYFGRVFKKEFGITPVEWREKAMQH